MNTDDQALEQIARETVAKQKRYFRGNVVCSKGGALYRALGVEVLAALKRVRDAEITEHNQLASDLKRDFNGMTLSLQQENKRLRAELLESHQEQYSQADTRRLNCWNPYWIIKFVDKEWRIFYNGRCIGHGETPSDAIDDATDMTAADVAERKAAKGGGR